MTRELIRAPGHDRLLSLGGLAGAWIEHFCIHGPGDVQGRHLKKHRGVIYQPGEGPLPLDDEIHGLFADVYAHSRKGRRLYDDVFFSRAKGRAKSEIAGFLVLFEAFGPSRFAGFAKGDEVFKWRDFKYVYEPGEPMGQRVTYPFIRCLATEETQAGNTYDNVYYNLTEGPLADGLPRNAAGLTRTLLPDGGEIRPSTASNAAKDGGKESYVVYDEPMDLETPIPTPQGWTTIGELEAGDYVLGLDGEPVLVFGVAPVKYDRPCYEVTFDDGTSVVTDANHTWTTYDRHTTKAWADRTTIQMLNANWYGKHRFAVAQPAALALPSADLPLDPYVLGAWLGDGDSRAAKITAGDEDRDWMSAEFERLGYATSIYVPEGRAATIRFNHGMRYGKAGTSQHVLRDLGLLQNKHVPDAYLWGSIEQRLALLQGLMDTDGYVNVRGNCLFTNTNRRLVDAVVHLVRSLGWRTSEGVGWQSDERWGIGTTGQWRVSFTPSGMAPFRLPRKAARCRVEPSRKMSGGTRAIVSIEPVDSRPVRCIAVDSDDHLFLAGPGMLPTHNTHLYVLPELKAMYATVQRNKSKRKMAQPWALQTSTMYQTGEESQAELTHGRAQLIRDGVSRETRLLFDHREAPEGVNLDSREEIVAALREVYGPFADAMDLDGMVDREFFNVEKDIEETIRYFFNQPTAARNAWIGDEEGNPWARNQRLVAAEKPLGHEGDVVKPLEKDEEIVLFFDGSTSDDSTGLLAIRCSDGFPFLLGAWEQDPSGKRVQRKRHEKAADRAWRVDRVAVDRVVDSVHETYAVLAFRADVKDFESYVDAWGTKYGASYLIPATVGRFPHAVAWDMRAHTKEFTEAAERTLIDINNGDLLHGGDTRLTRHVLNARKSPNKYGTSISKSGRESPKKIDFAVCLIGARQLWRDLLVSPKWQERKKKRSGKVW